MRRGKEEGGWQALLRCHQLHTFLALLPCLLAFVLFGLPDVHGGGFQYGHGGGHGGGYGHGGGHGGHGHGGGYGHGHGGYGFASILNNPLIQCRLKGGSCVNINNCNTTLNIYKDICKSYNYDNVCCISRETVCHKFSGFCTNNTDFCITASKLFRQTSYYEPKKYVVLSWLACNATHRCCHPIKGKKKKKGYGHGHGHGGGYGHSSHGGGYGHGGHGGGYGHGHGGGGYGHGHGGGYGHGHGGGYGHG